jgi:hypothetical protein
MEGLMGVNDAVAVVISVVHWLDLVVPAVVSYLYNLVAVDDSLALFTVLCWLLFFFCTPLRPLPIFPNSTLRVLSVYGLRFFIHNYRVGIGFPCLLLTVWVFFFFILESG